MYIYIHMHIFIHFLYTFVYLYMCTNIATAQCVCVEPWGPWNQCLGPWKIPRRRVASTWWVSSMTGMPGPEFFMARYGQKRSFGGYIMVHPHRKWPFYGDIRDIPYPLTVTTSPFSQAENEPMQGGSRLAWTVKNPRMIPTYFLWFIHFFCGKNTCRNP